MANPRSEYHNLFAQIPDVLWQALEADSAKTGDSITKVLTRILQRHYHVDRESLPKPKRAGRKPKVTAEGV